MADVNVENDVVSDSAAVVDPSETEAGPVALAETVQEDLPETSVEASAEVVEEPTEEKAMDLAEPALASATAEDTTPEAQATPTDDEPATEQAPEVANEELTNSVPETASESVAVPVAASILAAAAVATVGSTFDGPAGSTEDTPSSATEPAVESTAEFVAPAVVEPAPEPVLESAASIERSLLVDSDTKVIDQGAESVQAPKDSAEPVVAPLDAPVEVSSPEAPIPATSEPTDTDTPDPAGEAYERVAAPEVTPDDAGRPDAEGTEEVAGQVEELPSGSTAGVAFVQPSGESHGEEHVIEEAVVVASDEPAPTPQPLDPSPIATEAADEARPDVEATQPEDIAQPENNIQSEVIAQPDDTRSVAVEDAPQVSPESVSLVTEPTGPAPIDGSADAVDVPVLVDEVPASTAPESSSDAVKTPAPVPVDTETAAAVVEVSPVTSETPMLTETVKDGGAHLSSVADEPTPAIESTAPEPALDESQPAASAVEAPSDVSVPVPVVEAETLVAEEVAAVEPQSTDVTSKMAEEASPQTNTPTPEVTENVPVAEDTKEEESSNILEIAAAAVAAGGVAALAGASIQSVVADSRSLETQDDAPHEDAEPKALDSKTATPEDDKPAAQVDVGTGDPISEDYVLVDDVPIPDTEQADLHSLKEPVPVIERSVVSLDDDETKEVVSSEPTIVDAETKDLVLVESAEVSTVDTQAAPIADTEASQATVQEDAVIVDTADQSEALTTEPVVVSMPTDESVDQSQPEAIPKAVKADDGLPVESSVIPDIIESSSISDEVQPAGVNISRSLPLETQAAPADVPQSRSLEVEESVTEDLPSAAYAGPEEKASAKTEAAEVAHIEEPLTAETATRDLTPVVESKTTDAPNESPSDDNNSVNKEIAIGAGVVGVLGVAAAVAATRLPSKTGPRTVELLEQYAARLDGSGGSGAPESGLRSRNVAGGANPLSAESSHVVDGTVPLSESFHVVERAALAREEAATSTKEKEASSEYGEEFVALSKDGGATETDIPTPIQRQPSTVGLLPGGINAAFRVPTPAVVLPDLDDPVAKQMSRARSIRRQRRNTIKQAEEMVAAAVVIYATAEVLSPPASPTFSSPSAGVFGPSEVLSERGGKGKEKDVETPVLLRQDYFVPGLEYEGRGRTRSRDTGAVQEGGLLSSVADLSVDDKGKTRETKTDEDKGVPVSPRRSSHHSSRHRVHRERDSRDGSKESSRHSQRHRSESHTSIKSATESATRPRTPTRRDSAISENTGSGSPRTRRRRTPEEQEAHDKRKEERRRRELEKAKEEAAELEAKTRSPPKPSSSSSTRDRSEADRRDRSEHSRRERPEGERRERPEGERRDRPEQERRDRPEAERSESNHHRTSRRHSRASADPSKPSTPTDAATPSPSKKFFDIKHSKGAVDPNFSIKDLAPKEPSLKDLSVKHPPNASRTTTELKRSSTSRSSTKLRKSEDRIRGSEDRGSRSHRSRDEGSSKGKETRDSLAGDAKARETRETIASTAKTKDSVTSMGASGSSTSGEGDAAHRAKRQERRKEREEKKEKPGIRAAIKRFFTN